MTTNVKTAASRSDSARVQQVENTLETYRKQVAEQERELENRMELVSSLRANITMVRRYIYWNELY